ncbi:bifunctional glutamate N-acetyltransferase/amino-acid acetyltransferase ArgJ [Bythopirellula polymerisocia]|uniref:Arginine biosynthesis bifunctional protein ArgJ n=1 Tax=Bythopirellula polymerisocia TaxID=2528003 RepID=A0A5C6CN86_9BACT|nr:bifunctional glutamate N-acetyltransferase/amino-acid acetyltransferase ArgJ [Bythopirellula polymerisocia]TWU25892.1 Arginine biosynthesis bifunctional protein ArgJ [Bythopirellula polymerisocia]
MAERLPKGYRAAGVYTGVKRNPTKKDLSLFVTDSPAIAVGVYTQNLVVAAPVKLCKSRTPSKAIRAVVANSGVANACTGEQGDRDALFMAAKTAQTCGIDAEEVLVMSTGVIGEMLPMDKISAGIDEAFKILDTDEQSLVEAARGILTTDTVHKVKTRQFEIDGVPICITGIAKGAAMIGPNLATMLALILTDANIGPEDADAGLKDAADESFNCISVDGHTSTNDTVLLLANGAAGGPQLTGQALAKFQATLVEVCEDLAQSIPADGEGASHLITVEIHGCRSRSDAVKIAKTVADSPLVKTAIAGNDPNWGRIVSAAGYAGIEFDPAKVSLLVNGMLLYDQGQPVKFDEAVVSESMRSQRNTLIVLLMDGGTASARFWTTDLTAEYVRLNADYHT